MPILFACVGGLSTMPILFAYVGGTIPIIACHIVQDHNYTACRMAFIVVLELKFLTSQLIQTAHSAVYECLQMTAKYLDC